jgi:hypothetical protein
MQSVNDFVFVVPNKHLPYSFLITAHISGWPAIDRIVFLTSICHFAAAFSSRARYHSSASSSSSEASGKNLTVHFAIFRIQACPDFFLGEKLYFSPICSLDTALNLSIPRCSYFGWIVISKVSSRIIASFARSVGGSAKTAANNWSVVNEFAVADIGFAFSFCLIGYAIISRMGWPKSISNRLRPGISIW